MFTGSYGDNGSITMLQVVILCTPLLHMVGIIAKVSLVHQGDFFDLTSDCVGHFDRVWDRFVQRIF